MCRCNPVKTSQDKKAELRSLGLHLQSWKIDSGFKHIYRKIAFTKDTLGRSKKAPRALNHRVAFWHTPPKHNNKDEREIVPLEICFFRSLPIVTSTPFIVS